MALSRIKVWGNEILTATDLNAEFNNIINNASSLISPLSGSLDWDGYAHTLDAAGVTTAQSTASSAWSFVPGSKSGTPSTTGGISNWAASIWTDSNTAGSGTATTWAAHTFQRPTLAASNASVTTTNAATVYIANAPLAGTNETITNAYALWIPSGAVRFDGALTVTNWSGFPTVNEFRLSLTTATPVTTGDVTAATTLYWVPYTGGHVSLYDGTQWKLYATTEKSIAVPGTTNTLYDVFVYDNAGVVTLELTAWTNDTTRATALTYQDGVLVKTGAVTRRYVGSFRTTGVNGQTEDSLVKRYLWNYYHRVTRAMKAIDTTDSWTYTTNTIRQANANTANQLDYVCGVSEDAVEATVAALFNNSASAKVAVYIGVDSTTANSSQIFGGLRGDTGSSHYLQPHAHYRGYPGAGRHYLTWLESSTATGTTTWYGDNGAGDQQSGIVGSVRG